MEISNIPSPLFPSLPSPLEMEEGDGYPLPQDLLYTCLWPWASLPCAMSLRGELAIAIPLSRQLGVRDRMWIRALSVPKLETFYKRNKHQPSQVILPWVKPLLLRNDLAKCFGVHCSSSLSLPCRHVSTGAKSDMWDCTPVWLSLSLQPVAEAHYWYYITELGFYWSLLLCVCGCKVEGMCHSCHLTHSPVPSHKLSCLLTQTLLSPHTNSPEMFKMQGLRKDSFTVFYDFLIFRIVRNTLFVPLDFFQPFFGFYFFNALLLVLQALHIFWAWLILRMVYKFVFMGKVSRLKSSFTLLPSRDFIVGRETSWELSKGSLNSKLALLANNCVLNNLTNHGNMNSRLPKAFSFPSTVYAGNTLLKKIKGTLK
uniref:Uncharacterized protein n=1 Tax=Salmo trutta TaxID=8032 RepID=A0A673X722_SALTR